MTRTTDSTTADGRHLIISRETAIYALDAMERELDIAEEYDEYADVESRRNAVIELRAAMNRSTRQRINHRVPTPYRGDADDT